MCAPVSVDGVEPVTGAAFDAPLEAVELMRVSVPLLSAHRSASATQRTRESILVHVRDRSGSVGLAECPTLDVPGYATETTSEAWAALSSQLAPSWLAGHRVPSPGAPAASAAMADAHLDSQLRSRGVPLAQHLGETAGSAARSVRWCAVIADVAATPEAAVQAARVALNAGASMLKFKFDDPARLGEIVAAVRRVTHHPIAADANGSLSIEAALEVDDLGLRYLEQPLPDATPWEDLARLRSSSSTPVCLDESLRSPDALADALAADAMDVASIKAPRMGGVTAAAAGVRICASRGVPCFVGGMFELGIGRATALAVAAMPGCTLPTDLGPSQRYFARDVCEPLVTDQLGRVSVPLGAGIGRTLDEAALAEHLVDRLALGF